jgi:hypothetical protein
MYKSAGFLFFILILAGCGDQKTVTGPTGPQGPSGPNDIQVSLQNGVFPSASYNGEFDTWLDSANTTTPQNGTSYRRVKVGNTINTTEPTNDYGRVILRFDVSSIPVNATVSTVRLLMTTETSTNLGSSSVTVGLHALSSSLSGGCSWTSSATWSLYGTGSWNDCDSDTSDGQKGMYNATALSTVVFNGSYTGVSKVVEYAIPASVVQNWISGNNLGLVLVSEGEFQSVSTANVDFYPYNSATATNSPQLIVTYE